MASRSEAPGTAGRGRAFVTGLKGFTGRYVAEVLRGQGYRVFGSAFGVEPSAEPGVDTVLPLDLRDRAAVRAAVDEVSPDVVVHLAAIAFVAHGDIEEMYRMNLLATRHLLEALAAQQRPPSQVVLASSANVYGNAAVEPIEESTALSPANDYALSKWAMEGLARLWSDRLPIVVARPFNYTGVGQSVQFLLPKIVSHFARSERTIELGNIDVWRDYSDVRDIARGYGALVEDGRPGEVFNLCSGVGWSVREVLELMRQIAGYEIEVRVNPAFVRASEIRRLVGSQGALERRAGRFERIPLIDTLRWMLDSARPA